MNDTPKSFFFVAYIFKINLQPQRLKYRKFLLKGGEKMKGIKSDKVFEKKIRIYETYRLDELNEYYQKHSKEYGNVNEFLVSLIFNGLEAQKMFEKDSKTYFFKSQELAQNVCEIQSKLMNMKLNDEAVYKDLLNVLYQNQLLLCRLYNGMFDIAQNGSIDKKFYNAGFHDDPPEYFDDDKENIANRLNAEFGIKPKF